MTKSVPKAQNIRVHLWFQIVGGIMTDWKYSTIHKSTCKVVDEQALWRQTVCRVWLPNQDAVVGVPKSDLTEIGTQNSEPGTQNILYVSAAVKVAEVLKGFSGASDGHILLAPMESNVIVPGHRRRQCALFAGRRGRSRKDN